MLPQEGKVVKINVDEYLFLCIEYGKITLSKTREVFISLHSCFMFTSRMVFSLCQTLERWSSIKVVWVTLCNQIAMFLSDRNFGQDLNCYVLNYVV